MPPNEFLWQLESSGNLFDDASHGVGSSDVAMYLEYRIVPRCFIVGVVLERWFFAFDLFKRNFKSGFVYGTTAYRVSNG